MNAKADFLLEIGCEEIPAGMIAKACAEFQVILEKYLSTNGLLDKDQVEVFGAPRRIAAICKGLLLKQADSRARSHGPAEVDRLRQCRHADKGGRELCDQTGNHIGEDLLRFDRARRIYGRQESSRAGARRSRSLARFVPRAIAEIPWPRAMYWTGKDGSALYPPDTLAGGAAGRQSSSRRDR